MGSSGVICCPAGHRFDNRAEQKSPAFGAQRPETDCLDSIDDGSSSLTAVERPPAVLKGKAVSRHAVVFSRPPAGVALEFAANATTRAGALAGEPHVLNLQRLL